MFAYYQESDLRSHPCHQQYPEVQANLYLPSLQAPQGVLSGQLDLDDPAVGKGKKKKKSRSQTGTLQSSQGHKIFALLMKLTNVSRIDHSFILPSFITGRRRKQLFKVKQAKNNDGFMHKAWLAHLSRVLILTIKNYRVYCGCHI